MAALASLSVSISDILSLRSPLSRNQGRGGRGGLCQSTQRPDQSRANAIFRPAQRFEDVQNTGQGATSSNAFSAQPKCSRVFKTAAKARNFLERLCWEEGCNNDSQGHCPTCTTTSQQANKQASTQRRSKRKTKKKRTRPYEQKPVSLQARVLAFGYIQTREQGPTAAVKNSTKAVAVAAAAALLYHGWENHL